MHFQHIVVEKTTVRVMRTIFLNFAYLFFGHFNAATNFAVFVQHKARAVEILQKFIAHCGAVEFIIFDDDVYIILHFHAYKVVCVYKCHRRAHLHALLRIRI